MVTILILLSGAVFLVELMNVDLTKLIPLANLGCGILGDNGSFAVAGEGLVGVMHDAAVVVWVAKGAALLVFEEIVLLAHFYVVPHNLHVIISIRCTLLMEESQGMNKLMDNRTLSHAALSHRMSMQIEILHFALVAHLGVATRVLCL